MARYLYSELAGLVQMRLNRFVGMNNGRDAIAAVNEARPYTERIEELITGFMQFGSGFEVGVRLDLDASHGEKLVFLTGYRHADGEWTHHTVTITPSFVNRYHIRISGRNKDDIKTLIDGAFYVSLVETEWTPEEIDPEDTTRIFHEMQKRRERGIKPNRAWDSTFWPPIKLTVRTRVKQLRDEGGTGLGGIPLLPLPLPHHLKTTYTDPERTGE